jgi:hypothetical protein
MAISVNGELIPDALVAHEYELLLKTQKAGNRGTLKSSTLLLSILAIATGAPLAAQTYTFSNAECNNFALSAYGMNGAGVIVGAADDGGAIYSNGKCETYPSVFLYGVADNEWLIGGVKGGHTYELIQPGPKVTPLPEYPGAHGTEYCCMQTSSGTLAGNYYPVVGVGTLVGFFYNIGKGKFSSLPWIDATGAFYTFTLAAMNNTGIVVGTDYGYHSGLGNIGFIYQKGKMTLLAYPGATYTYFQGVNDNGVVVGAYNVKSTGVSNIFTYDIATNTWTDLNFPYPYNAMHAIGISNSGVIALTGASGAGVVLATPPAN